MRVMKYGGTSVKDPDAIRRLIAQVQDARQRDASPAGATRGPVLVVSALSKVTDTLLQIAQAAVEGKLPDAYASIEVLRVRHIAMADALIPEGAARQEVLAVVRTELDDLDAVAHALSVLGEISPRSQDVIAALGELLSSRIVAAALDASGVPSAWVDARRVLVTSDEHTAAQPLMQETSARLLDEVMPLIDQGRVVVVGGFVGATREGITTTLGRGGSDYSASIIGACLDATEIEIWTDVDGMLTADPRLVSGGRVVPELSFDEASELAYFGAKVLHPSTILPAMTRGIPVRILNSTRPQNPGTRIAATAGCGLHELAAIACKRHVTKIDIASTRMLMAWGFMSRVFAVFEKHRTPVDVVTTSEVAVSLTIDDRRHLPAIVEALSAFAEVSVNDNMAIVSAVGERLSSDSSLSARVLGALEGFPLEMVSQGGSRKNITFVVPDACTVAAMTRLHERFFKDAADTATVLAQA